MFRHIKELQFDARVSNMSNGASARGPWNQGQGPWKKGEEWVYVDDPNEVVRSTKGLKDMPIKGTSKSVEDVRRISVERAKIRSGEVRSATSTGENAWCSYPQTKVEAPSPKLKKVS